MHFYKSSCIMFLEWVKIHIGPHSLSLFDFIDWFSCKWLEGMVLV